MKTKFTLFIMFWLLSQTIYAQSQPNRNMQSNNGQMNGTIKGIVIDSKSQQPIEYANIALYRSKDSTLITGTISNEKGIFILENLPFGMYYMTATFMGFNKTKIAGIQIRPNQNEKDLGTIKLESTTTELNDVQVTAEKKTVEYSLDKKVVNVDKNLVTVGGTAVDVLQSVPSVTVDQDGAVSLRGNSNVTILIDGKPSSITGTNLESLPASSIESIEVITNPSAKYNPEGMSGIINIKLKKKTNKGLNGVIMANAGTKDKYSGSVNLNYNAGFINIFGAYDMRHHNMTGNGGSTRSIYTEGGSYLNSSTEWKRKRNSNNFKLGVDLAINPKTSLTLTWLNNNSNRNGDDNSITHEQNQQNVVLSHYKSSSSEPSDDKSMDFTLNFKRNLSKKGEEFTIDAVYSTSTDDEHNYILTYYDVIPQKLNINSNPENKDNYTKAKNKTFDIQANYVYPFSEKSKFEAGFQSIIRSKDDDYSFNLFNFENNNWQNKPELNNHFVYDEKIYAIYGTYSNTYKNFSFQIGTRIEQANTTSEQKTLNKDYTSSYFSIFPSLHITQKLSQSEDLQLSYSRRINRPRLGMVNPFIESSDPLYLRYGNPELKPEYINSLEFGYTKIWNKLTLNSSVFYRNIENAINRYVFVDENNITNMTFANISSGQSFGVEIVLDQQIAKWWRINLNGSYFRTIMKSDDQSGMSNDNFSWTSKLMSNWIFSKTFSTQLSINYRGPMVMLQSQMDPMFSTDLALKKDFLAKNNLSVTFRISDIFNTMKFAGKSWGETNGVRTFDATNSRKMESRLVWLGISYKFGGDYKQRQRKKSDDGGGSDMDFE